MNKLILAITFAAVFFSMEVKSQSQDKSTISILAGPSLPVGEFKLNDSKNHNSGYAKTGGFLDISYSYRFSRYVGAQAVLKGKIYGLDLSNYSVPTGTGIGMQLETTAWWSMAELVGVFADFPLDRRGIFHLGIKGLVGLQYTRSPEMKIRLTGVIGMPSGKQESAGAFSPAGLVGANLNYRSNRSLGLILSTDYNRSRPRFHNISASSGGTNIDLTSEQLTSSVDIGLGLAIRF